MTNLLDSATNIKMLVLAAGMLLIAGVAVEAYNPAYAPLFRYFGNGDHFYTTDINEVGQCTSGQIGTNGYKSEGIAAIVHARAVPGAVPLFRYYRTTPSRNHFYTRSPDEIGVIIPGWVGLHRYKSEGIAGYVYPTQKNGTVPLHRYYNNRGSIDDHFYTLDTFEIGTHLRPGQTGRLGYTYEGVACYVYRPGV